MFNIDTEISNISLLYLHPLEMYSLPLFCYCTLLVAVACACTASSGKFVTKYYFTKQTKLLISIKTVRKSTC